MQEAEREKQREFPQGGLKRDKSLLFTAVPEEDHSMISPPSRGLAPGETKPTMPDVVPFSNKPRPRPTKLSLGFKAQKSVDEDAAEEKRFTGQTSVCSTPMVEYKRLHGNMLSICQNPDGGAQEPEPEPDVLSSVDAQLKSESEKRDNRMVLNINCIADHFVNKPEPIRKLASVMDIQETFRKLSSKATSRFKLKRSQNEEDSPEEETKSPSTLTINDPLFPVFRNDGVAISESLFNQYLEQYYSRISQESKEEKAFFSTRRPEPERFEGFDSEFTRSPQRTPKKIVKDSAKTLPSDQSRRKALSLPLKSLTENSEQIDMEAVNFKKKLTGVQLTPLMEKLSHLAFTSDKSSGYSSRVMTPLEIRDLMTPAAERQVNFTDR